MSAALCCQPIHNGFWVGSCRRNPLAAISPAGSEQVDCDSDTESACGKAGYDKEQLGGPAKLRLRKLETLAKDQAVDVISDVLEASEIEGLVKEWRLHLNDTNASVSAVADVTARSGKQLPSFQVALQHVVSVPSTARLEGVQKNFQQAAQAILNDPLGLPRIAEIISAGKASKLRPVFKPDDLPGTASAILVRAASLWEQIRQATVQASGSSSSGRPGNQSSQLAAESPANNTNMSAPLDNSRQPALEQPPDIALPSVLGDAGRPGAESSHITAGPSTDGIHLSTIIDHPRQPALQQLPDELKPPAISLSFADPEPTLEEPFGSWSSPRQRPIVGGTQSSLSGSIRSPSSGTPFATYPQDQRDAAAEEGNNGTTEGSQDDVIPGSQDDIKDDSEEISNQGYDLRDTLSPEGFLEDYETMRNRESMERVMILSEEEIRDFGYPEWEAEESERRAQKRSRGSSRDVSGQTMDRSNDMTRSETRGPRDKTRIDRQWTPAANANLLQGGTADLLPPAVSLREGDDDKQRFWNSAASWSNESDGSDESDGLDGSDDLDQSSEWGKSDSRVPQTPASPRPGVAGRDIRQDAPSPLGAVVQRWQPAGRSGRQQGGRPTSSDYRPQSSPPDEGGAQRDSRLDFRPQQTRDILGPSRAGKWQPSQGRGATGERQRAPQAFAADRGSRARLGVARGGSSDDGDDFEAFGREEGDDSLAGWGFDSGYEWSDVARKSSDSSSMGGSGSRRALQESAPRDSPPLQGSRFQSNSWSTGPAEGGLPPDVVPCSEQPTGFSQLSGTKQDLGSAQQQGSKELRQPLLQQRWESGRSPDVIQRRRRQQAREKEQQQQHHLAQPQQPQQQKDPTQQQEGQTQQLSRSRSKSGVRQVLPLDHIPTEQQDPQQQHIGSEGAQHLQRGLEQRCVTAWVRSGGDQSRARGRGQQRLNGGRGLQGAGRHSGAARASGGKGSGGRGRGTSDPGGAQPTARISQDDWDAWKE